MPEYKSLNNWKVKWPWRHRRAHKWGRRGTSRQRRQSVWSPGFKNFIYICWRKRKVKERITRVFAALILSLRDSFLQQNRLFQQIRRSGWKCKNVEWWFWLWLLAWHNQNIPRLQKNYRICPKKFNTCPMLAKLSNSDWPWNVNTLSCSIAVIWSFIMCWTNREKIFSRKAIMILGNAETAMWYSIHYPLV